MAMTAFTILAALCLSSAAADCGSALGSCDDGTSLVQIKKKFQPGSTRPNDGMGVAPMEKRVNAFKEKELAKMEEDIKAQSSSASGGSEDRQVGSSDEEPETSQDAASEHSNHAESFVGTVGNRKWIFWFRKAPKHRVKPEESDFKEIAKGGDESNLFSLTPASSQTEGSASIQLWGWGAFDGWGRYPGLGGLGGLGGYGGYGGLGCPDLGLGIPGCSWGAQALRNGFGWRNAEWGLGDSWLAAMPPWRHSWEVFAALPADHKQPLELAAKPEEIKSVSLDIEDQMKAANYAVDGAEFKDRDTDEQREADNDDDHAKVDDTDEKDDDHAKVELESDPEAAALAD